MAEEEKTKFHSMAPHGGQKAEGADKVVGIILQGLGHALPHSLQPGEVDDGINTGMPGEQGLHLVLMAQLRLDKGDLFSGDLLHPPQSFLAGVAEVVRHYDIIPGLQKLHAGMAADITGSAANQNRHIVLLLQDFKLGRRPVGLWR